MLQWLLGLPWEAIGKVLTGLLAVAGFALGVANYRRGRDQYRVEIWVGRPKLDKGVYRIAVKVANLGNKPFAIRQAWFEKVLYRDRRRLKVVPITQYQGTFYELIHDEGTTIVQPGAVKVIEAKFSTEDRLPDFVHIRLHNGIEANAAIDTRTTTRGELIAFAEKLVAAALAGAKWDSFGPVCIFEHCGRNWDLDLNCMLDGSRTIDTVTELPPDSPHHVLADAYPELFAMGSNALDHFTLEWTYEAFSIDSKPHMFDEWVEKYRHLVPRTLHHTQAYIDPDGTIRVENHILEGVPGDKVDEVAANFGQFLSDQYQRKVDERRAAQAAADGHAEGEELPERPARA